jgi:hypothetical protein
MLDPYVSEAPQPIIVAARAAHPSVSVILFAVSMVISVLLLASA